MRHEFILVFRLANKNEDPRVHADGLKYCYNARPSFGIRGYLAVEFDREAPTLTEAKRSAVRDIQYVVPEAKLDVLSE